MIHLAIERKCFPAGERYVVYLFKKKFFLDSLLMQETKCFPSYCISSKKREECFSLDTLPFLGVGVSYVTLLRNVNLYGYVTLPRSLFGYVTFPRSW